MSKKRNLIFKPDKNEPKSTEVKIEIGVAKSVVQDNNLKGELLVIATIDHFAKELY